MKNTLPISKLMTHEVKKHLYPPEEIAKRARRLLYGKSDWYLELLADYILHFLKEYDEHAISRAIEDTSPVQDPELFIEEEDNKGNKIHVFDEKQVQRLPAEVVTSIGPTYALIEWLAINSAKEKNQLSKICEDYQAFATLALVYFSKSTNKQNPFGYDEKIPVCPIWAMEALCYAEMLVALKTLDKKNRKVIEAELTEQKKQWSRAGNKKKHSQGHEAKALAILLWEQRRKSNDSNINCESMAKAGNSLTPILSERGYDYEPDTIAGWLRAYAKDNNIKL